MSSIPRIAETILWLGGLAVALGAAACKSAPARPAETRTLARGYHSGVVERAVRVARDESEWRDLWREHAGFTVPRPEAPEVDWEREMVVGAFLGARATAGYALEIRDVRRDGKKLVVEARESEPARDRIVPQVVTHPYHLVAVARVDGEPVLELR